MAIGTPPFPADPRPTTLTRATTILVNVVTAIASLAVLAGFLWMVFAS